MATITEHRVELAFSPGKGVQALIAQIPDHLRLEKGLFKLQDPGPQFELLRSILEVGALKKVPGHTMFILFPESSVPFSHLTNLISHIEKHLEPSTVVIFGVEHIALSQYIALLKEFREDNSTALDLAIGDRLDESSAKPVNTCVTVVKESTGATRCFFSAKTHPFSGEESVDHLHDLYRGKTFNLFRCGPVPFNFMPLVCFDYVFRDLHSSNIMTIIERANQLYFQERQRLDLLTIIQCNPKPEHRVFKDVVTGYYGEYLFKAPGTSGTVTLFVNTSDETELEGSHEADSFGFSSIVCGRKHKMPRIKLSEFRSDDFMGAPVARLRFGPSTRLFLTHIFPYHETDPRSSRMMLKVKGVFRQSETSTWERISGDDMVMGLSEEDLLPPTL